MNHIEIGGVQHPLLFNFNSLRNIMEIAGLHDFSELKDIKQLAESLDFALNAAFYGIAEGYAAKDEESPYLTPHKLGSQITRLSQLQPALNAFTDAVSEFFKTDEPEGKTKPRAKARR
jgi:hypothetical protein